MVKTNERLATESHKHQGKGYRRRILLVIGIILLALNLRSSITGVGPLVGTIRHEAGLSNVLLGLITTLPLLAFGAFSPLAPRLGRRWGIECVLFISLLGLIAGILLRSVPVTILLFAGTALLGMAIALSNVLLPALIKRDFPRQIGLMTGLYSTLISISGAIADGVSIPLAQGTGLGWRGSLIFWAIPATLTVFIWLPLLRARPRATGVSQEAHPATHKLWRTPLAWQVTLFMGLQSLLFYVAIAWLPTILQSEGLSAASAGWMLSLLQFSGVLASFLVPLLAGRMRSQRLLVSGTILLCLSACVGLLSAASSLVALWCILFGLSQGSFLSLALMFFILRTPDTRSAAELSGMAQSVGYLLAALGPLLFGWLHDLTQAWTIPLLSLILIMLLIFGVGMGAARNITVASQRTEEVSTGAAS